MHFGVKYDLHDVLCEIHESPTNSSVNNHTGLRWHWVAGFSNTLNLVSPLCVRKTPSEAQSTTNVKDTPTTDLSHRYWPAGFVSTILKHIKFAIEQGLDHTDCSSMVKKQLRMIRPKNKHLTSSTHSMNYITKYTHIAVCCHDCNCIKLRNQTQVNWHW